MKFLVIGCGSIGRRHTGNLKAITVDDILVFDPDKRRSAMLAREYDVVQTDSLEQAYDLRPDVVLVCAPTNSHLALAKEALQHDCHIFLEKPLSHTVEGAPEFVAELKMRNRVLLMGYNLRFDPILAKIQRWLNEARIGEVSSVRLHVGSYLPWRHPREDYRVGYGARSTLGGGVILDASHELDYALWLFGPPNNVYCAGGKHSNLEIDVEDVVEIVMSYERSIISVHLDYISQSAQRTTDIVGTRGQIHADLIGRTLSLFDESTRTWSVPQVYCAFDELYRLEMKHLIDCVSGNMAPAVDASAGLQTLLLASAAKRSMISGEPVIWDVVSSAVVEPPGPGKTLGSTTLSCSNV